MSKLCTTIEESKKLMELGIDVNTADMSYSSIHNIGQEVSYCNLPLCICPMADDIPAWSLTALLDILPKTVKHKTFFVELETLFIETSALLWHIGYRNIYIAKADNLLDAAFEMVVWLKKNGII